MSYSDENVDDFFANINVDSALQSILRSDASVWLSVLEQNIDQKSPLTEMKHGLNLAQTLGDAAKNGFKAIYFPIDKNNWYEQTISYYVSLLHKRIIGESVFETKMFNGNRFDSHFYAHCTRNMSGSFTLFGVNAGDSKLDVTAKLPFRSGTEYMEFILTVSVNGKVQLNGREIIEPAVLVPVPKSKLPGKATDLNMPAYSIAFWVFTEADIPECSYDDDDMSYYTTEKHLKTSSERLLQELIIEAVSQNDGEKNVQTLEVNSISRSKRHTTLKRNRRYIDDGYQNWYRHNSIQQNSDKNKKIEQSRNKRFLDGANHIRNGNEYELAKNKRHVRPKRDVSLLKNLFEKFDLKKPVFDFKKTTSLKHSLLPSISTIHDVFNKEKASDSEKKLFETVENPNLPIKDVHLEVGVDATMHEEKSSGYQAINQHFYGNTDYGNIGLATVNGNTLNGIPSSALLGELSEIEIPHQNVNVAPAVKKTTPTNQHDIEFIVKDLPPTYQVNQQNMEKARSNLQKNFWPIAATNSKISALLPNIAQFKLKKADADELFESRLETRRRRRSIDSKMNEEIEKRVQDSENKMNENYLDEAMNNIDLLDQMLKIADDIEQNERIATVPPSKQLLPKLGQGKFAQILKKNFEHLTETLGAQSTQNDIQKKCKIISMAVEQQCLQMDSKNKRSIKESLNNPLKRVLAKVRDNIKKHTLRTKRDADDEEEINMIPKFEYDEVKAKKDPMDKPNESMYKLNVAARQLGTVQDEEIEFDEGKHTAKILHQLENAIEKVESIVGNAVSNIMKRVATLWQSVSFK